MDREMVSIKNEQVSSLLRTEYTLDSLGQIYRLLAQHRMLSFPTLSSGLFSAALASPQTRQTGYQAAWVRDNVHVVHAHLVNGQKKVAWQNIVALCKFFARYRPRFEAVIENPHAAADPMQRPHIRFDDETLSELPEKWAHTQNDALGSFVWLYAKLAGHRILEPDTWDVGVLALFLRYFQAIQYWQDEDSGHWEETRKISASSIGAVVAGLRQLRTLLHSRASTELLRRRVSSALLDAMIARGTTAPYDILLTECAQPNPMKNHRYDAALLFLVYPRQVVDKATAKQIVDDVTKNLQTERGMKRYLGDSFYCSNYEHNLRDTGLIRDYSDDMATRNDFFVEGGEAQWCIFDPIVSICYGLQYQRTGSSELLDRQTYYLNRSLGQITGSAGRCGAFQSLELYYFEDGCLQTSISTPLLWTQENLWIALKTLEESVRISG